MLSHCAVQAGVGRYNQGGLAALQERPHTGRPPRLAAADVPRFRDRLEAGPTPEDGVCTFRCQDVARCILEEEFGVSLRRQAIYDLLHRLDYSSLMPRPQHEQANPEVQEFFKEIVVEQIDAIAAVVHPEEEIHTYFQDEARFGQKGTITRVWGAVGFATARRGADGIQLALRAGGRLRRHGGDVGGDHAHAEHRGRQPVLGAVRAGELPAGVHAVLIYHGPGFHTGEDVVVPSNVSLIQLPPYSPELNPVENLWHYLRAHHWSEPPVPGLRRIAGGGGQESVCGPRRHRNDQDRLQSSRYLKGRMKLPESDKFRMLLHTNPTCERGECLGTRAGALEDR